MEPRFITVGERTFKVLPELEAFHSEAKDFRGCFDIFEEEEELGSIAYNHTSWEFHHTKYLNAHEQVELAELIYQEFTACLEQLKTPDHPEFHPFYMQGMYHGGMESFEILPGEDTFKVAYDGRIIAELTCQGNWKQLNGDPLPGDLFQDILYQIGKHYD